MLGANIAIGQPPIITGLGGVSNFKPSNTRRLRAAKGRVLAKTGRGVVGLVGDSTTAGHGSGTGTNGLDGARLKRPSYQAAALLDTTLTPVKDCGHFGAYGVTAVQQTTYDSRLALGSGWASASSSAAGGYYQNTTTTNALTYNISDAFDTLELWYIQSSGLGTITVDIDGGAALETINTSGSNAIVKKTYTGISLATHAVNIKRVSGTCRVIGISYSKSANPDLEIRSLGVLGATAASISLATNVWSSMPAHVALAMDAVFLDIGVNDWGNATDVTAFEASMNAYLTAVGAVSDIFLCSPVPRAVATTPLATQMIYVNILRRLARERDLPWVDWRALFETQEISTGLGLYYDQTHPSAPGYAVKAAYIAAIIGSV